MLTIATALFSWLMTTVGIAGVGPWSHLVPSRMTYGLYWLTKGRSKWSNESRSCVVTSNDAGRYNVTATAVTDISQLIIMLIGLLRTHRERNGLLGHLYVQVSGVVYSVPLMSMAICEIGLGLAVACRRRDSRNSNRSRFLFLAVARGIDGI